MSLIKRVCGRKFTVSPNSPVLTSLKSGIIVENSTINATEGILAATNLKIARVAIFLSTQLSSSTIDKYIDDGFLVQINVNWVPTTSVVPFPTDLSLYESRLNTFLANYQDRIDSIPLLICENEYDNLLYHSGGSDNYLPELNLFNSLCQTAGFKTADGGLTSTALQRWNYSNLSGSDALAWKSHYFVGLSDDYANFLIRINAFLDGISFIPLDYANVHWYNNISAYGGFPSAAGFIKEQTAKDKLITNEFGIKTNTFTLFQQTVNELKDDVEYAIAYSGINTSGKAITLSNQMLSFLAQTIK